MFSWLQTATLHMHFMPLHGLGNLEVSTISQVHCQLFETKQLGSGWPFKGESQSFWNWTAKIALWGCMEVPFCAFHTKQVQFTSQKSFSQSPFCKRRPATLRWFPAPSRIPRTGHVAAGASPITVLLRRVAEKNPFHGRVGSAALLVRKMCSCQSIVQGETENQIGIVDGLLIQKGTYEITDLSEISLSSVCVLMKVDLFLTGIIYFWLVTLKRHD